MTLAIRHATTRRYQREDAQMLLDEEKKMACAGSSRVVGRRPPCRVEVQVRAVVVVVVVAGADRANSTAEVAAVAVTAAATPVAATVEARLAGTRVARGEVVVVAAAVATEAAEAKSRTEAGQLRMAKAPQRATWIDATATAHWPLVVAVVDVAVVVVGSRHGLRLARVACDR